MSVDATDVANNTGLHHAALSNKLNVCKYLVEEQKVKTDIKNSEGHLAIDLTTSTDIEKFLGKFQTKTVKKSGGIANKFKSIFAKKDKGEFDLQQEINFEKQKGKE